MFRSPLLFLLALTAAESMRVKRDETAAKVDNLESTLNTVTRQLMMTQFYIEEIARASENSGIKRIRTSRSGPHSYNAPTVADASYINMHNHANYPDTPGLGEFAVVMNGVDFKTRHNDYKLFMKSTTSKDYGATEPLPFPEVPPTVKGTIDEQIAEMREYFRAWGAQDKSIRDYRDYFKAALCYLEGAWTISDSDTIDEPFASDRHTLDAATFAKLEEKVRFMSHSGNKDELENFAYLPSKLWAVNGSAPVIAQWNYQILCHPVRRNVAVNRLLPIDNLQSRLTKNLKLSKYETASRMGRYEFAPVDAAPGKWEDTEYRQTLLDNLMSEIPGFDNYPARIKDTLFDQTTYDLDPTKDKIVNAGYYHRVHRTNIKDANGRSDRRRGFADENLFVALTTQEKIPGLTVEKCNKKGGNCQSWTQKFTYAFPLELIYLTPLTKWNPYNLIYRGDATTEEGVVANNGPLGNKTRFGLNHPDKAYDGLNNKCFYQTPYAFFEGDLDKDPADTNADVKHVLDPVNRSKIHKCRASGIRIHFPNIPGVGALRQRYPIAPTSFSGHACWKELDALKEMFFSPDDYANMFPGA